MKCGLFKILFYDSLAIFLAHSKKNLARSHSPCISISISLRGLAQTVRQVLPIRTSSNTYGSHKSVPQMAFRSVQPFLQGSWLQPTDRQIERQINHTMHLALVMVMYAITILCQMEGTFNHYITQRIFYNILQQVTATRMTGLHIKSVVIKNTKISKQLDNIYSNITITAHYPRQLNRRLVASTNSTL